MKLFFPLVIGVSLISLTGRLALAGDLDNFQGQWRMEEPETTGKDTTERRESQTLTIKNSTFEEKSHITLHYRIETEVKNDYIVIKTNDAPQGGNKIAVVELKDHEFIEKQDLEGKELPKSFASLSEAKAIVTKWKRLGLPPDPSLPVLKRLEGDWEMESMVVAGRDTGKLGMNVKIKIGNNRWDVVNDWNRHGKIELTGKNNEIDFRYDGLPGVRMSRFEFIDKDSFRVCSSLPGRDRPADFSPKNPKFYSTKSFKRVVPEPAR